MDIRTYGDYVRDLVLLLATGSIEIEDFKFINEMLLDKVNDSSNKWEVNRDINKTKEHLYHHTIHLRNLGVLTNDEMKSIKRIFV